VIFPYRAFSGIVGHGVDVPNVAFQIVKEPPPAQTSPHDGLMLINTELTRICQAEN
jgi:hypothetical protein